MAGIQESISQLLTEMFADIKLNAQRVGKVNTGKTIASLEQRYESAEGGHTFQVWANKYFGALDTGSGPARKRVSDAEREAFIRDLAAWCAAKGFPQGGLSPEQYARAAKWLKWYIGKYGSLTYRTPAMQYKVIAPAIGRFEERLDARLSAFYDAEINNIFYQKK